MDLGNYFERDMRLFNTKFLIIVVLLSCVGCWGTNRIKYNPADENKVIIFDDVKIAARCLYFPANETERLNCAFSANNMTEDNSIKISIDAFPEIEKCTQSQEEDLQFNKISMPRTYNGEKYNWFLRYKADCFPDNIIPQKVTVKLEFKGQTKEKQLLVEKTDYQTMLDNCKKPDLEPFCNQYKLLTLDVSLFPAATP